MYAHEELGIKELIRLTIIEAKFLSYWVARDNENMAEILRRFEKLEKENENLKGQNNGKSSN